MQLSSYYSVRWVGGLFARSFVRSLMMVKLFQLKTPDKLLTNFFEAGMYLVQYVRPSLQPQPADFIAMVRGVGPTR